MKFLLALIPTLVLLTLIPGCSGEPAAPDAPVTLHEVRGQFVRPTFDGEAMRVDHEEIAGVMPAMTMDFQLEDPKSIAELEEGDTIEFIYVLGDGTPYAREVRRVEAAPDAED